VVIEKLLQFLVRQIDTELVKPIRLSSVTQGSDGTQRSVQMRNTHKREAALASKTKLFKLQ
jgi:hypothetical protein